MGARFAAGGKTKGSRSAPGPGRASGHRQTSGEKLCARFVADDPPTELRGRGHNAFIDVQGDIASVMRAISEEPCVLERPTAAQAQDPLELVVSAARALWGAPGRQSGAGASGRALGRAHAARECTDGASRGRARMAQQLRHARSDELRLALGERKAAGYRAGSGSRAAARGCRIVVRCNQVLLGGSATTRPWRTDGRTRSPRRRARGAAQRGARALARRSRLPASVREKMKALRINRRSLLLGGGAAGLAFSLPALAEEARSRDAKWSSASSCAVGSTGSACACRTPRQTTTGSQGIAIARPGSRDDAHRPRR